MHPELSKLLSHLRSRIRRYVLIEGCALLCAALCVLFWTTLLLDVFWFRVSRLELPGWLRTALLLGSVCLFAGMLLTYVIARSMRRLRTRALALLLERRFPELGDRLLTAVDFAESGSRTGVAAAMWQRTIDDAVRISETLDLRNVFDFGPLRRTVVVAGVLVVSVLGFGILNASAMERWFNAFVLREDDYWNPYRRSAIEVKVLVQPGDRIRHFDESGVYRHARGADLTILADADLDRVVPEGATLAYEARSPGGAVEGSVPMTPGETGRFRHTLGRVVDPHSLWVTAGDYVNRRPLRIEVVDPPKLDSVRLVCDFPDYTDLLDATRPVQGAQISLPIGTNFLLQAETNKSLRSYVIRSGPFDLRVALPNEADTAGEERRAGEILLTIQGDEESAGRTLDLTERYGSLVFDTETYDIAVPFRLTANAAAQLAEFASDPVTLQKQHPVAGIPLPPDTPLQILLEDTDEVFGIEPEQLTVLGVLDTEPVVDTRLRGVSSTVTRLASIPVEGRITDDYGVADARFGYRVNESEQLAFQPFENPPTGEKTFVLGAEDRTERFRLQPLGLTLGDTFSLTVQASDADDVTGPHEGRGQLFTFQVVSSDDLLASLYEQELNLRRRFEQILSEVIELHTEVIEARPVVQRLTADGDASASSEQSPDDLQSLLDGMAERSLHQLRKNHTELRAIEVAFADIRDEMVNNRVDTPTALERIDQGVLGPLGVLTETEFPEVDAALGLFELANARAAADERSEHLESVVLGLDRIIDRMEKILLEMQRRETFNELVRSLQSIIERQEQLQDKTKQQSLDELFEGLGLP